MVVRVSDWFLMRREMSHDHRWLGLEFLITGGDWIMWENEKSSEYVQAQSPVSRPRRHLNRLRISLALKLIFVTYLFSGETEIYLREDKEGEEEMQCLSRLSNSETFCWSLNLYRFLLLHKWLFQVFILIVYSKYSCWKFHFSTLLPFQWSLAYLIHWPPGNWPVGPSPNSSLLRVF